MSDQPVYWPKYLPFPNAIGRSTGMVPNRSSVSWPQAQFAPLYLPPGSPSFQPYDYPPDGPLSNFQPPLRLTSADEMPFPPSGPPGDIARLPYPYASENPMFALRNSSVSEVATAAEAPFDPFTPEMLEGVGEKRLKRLQILERLIVKMSSISRGPEAEAAYNTLLRIHDRVAANLAERAERRLRRRGLVRRAKEFLSKWKQRRLRIRARRQSEGLVEPSASGPGTAVIVTPEEPALTQADILAVASAPPSDSAVLTQADILAITPTPVPSELAPVVTTSTAVPTAPASQLAAVGVSKVPVDGWIKYRVAETGEIVWVRPVRAIVGAEFQRDQRERERIQALVASGAISEAQGKAALAAIRLT